MELLPALMLLAIFTLIVAIGVVVLLWLLRRSAETHADQSQNVAIEAAVASAVKTTLAERGATAQVVERDREATMRAAVDTAMVRSGEKLEKNLALGTEQLEKSLALSDAKLEKNLLVGQERYETGASFIEQQSKLVQTEMKRIEKMVNELQRETAGQHGALVNQLKETAKQTTQLQQTTGSLRDALGSTKKRGNWGERMAQDVLSFAGLKEGLNYRVQKGIESGGRPDFTFLMPQEMVLHMDVKFPADNYLNFLDAEGVDAAVAESFRKQFRKDARDRVKELAARKYQDDANSVDAVVLLIPNDSIFAFVQENDPELMDLAMASKIVLCGPSTLIAVLQIVRQSMDNFMLTRRSTEILDCLNGFKAEFVKYSDKVEAHGKHLNTALKSFEELSGTRTNVLQRNIDKIDRLQAATDSPIDTPADSTSPDAVAAAVGERDESVLSSAAVVANKVPLAVSQRIASGS